MLQGCSWNSWDYQSLFDFFEVVGMRMLELAFMASRKSFEDCTFLLLLHSYSAGRRDCAVLDYLRTFVSALIIETSFCQCTPLQYSSRLLPSFEKFTFGPSLLITFAPCDASSLGAQPRAIHIVFSINN